MTKEEIKKMYSEVFDENGQVKLCGREKCKDLISAMSQLFPNVDFGSLKTGFMNVENMKIYKEKI